MAACSTGQRPHDCWFVLGAQLIDQEVKSYHTKGHFEKLHPANEGMALSKQIPTTGVRCAGQVVFPYFGHQLDSSTNLCFHAAVTLLTFHWGLMRMSRLHRLHYCHYHCYQHCLLTLFNVIPHDTLSIPQQGWTYHNRVGHTTRGLDISQLGWTYHNWVQHHYSWHPELTTNALGIGFHKRQVCSQINVEQTSTEK